MGEHLVEAIEGDLVMEDTVHVWLGKIIRKMLDADANIIEFDLSAKTLDGKPILLEFRVRVSDAS